MSDFSPEKVPIAARALMELMLTQSNTWTCMVDTTGAGFAVFVDEMRMGSSLYEDVLYKGAVDYMFERGYIAPSSCAPRVFYQVTFRGLEQAEQWHIDPLEPSERMVASR